MTDVGEAAGNTSVAQPSAAPPSRGRAAAAGLRQPTVAILLLIALFTTASGKPLDGFLMLAVATMLIFDSARSRRLGVGRHFARDVPFLCPALFWPVAP